jgi:gliding motility-associated-like protein
MVNQFEAEYQFQSHSRFKTLRIDNMRRLTIILGFALIATNAMAQALEKRIVFPDSVTSVEADWVDVDNDGLLDILMLLKTRQGNDYVRIVKGDASATIISDTAASVIKERSFPIISYDAYILTDYDRDNSMDILISGQHNGANVTMIYLNKGAFKFESSLTSIPHFSQACFADFDDNATPELIVSGADSNGPYTKILKQVDDASWKPVHDSLMMQCSSIQAFDADGDGDNDLFVSGTLNTGAPASAFYINHGDFYFKPENMISLRGTTSTGDLNGDGFFDLILMGEDERGSWHTKKYQHTSDAFTIQDLPITLTNGRPFVADFDHDGTADINYLGIDHTGQATSIFQYGSGATVPLPAPNVRMIKFGDLKHDGNLESIITMVDAGLWSLSIADDMSQVENSPPGRPDNAIALPVFDRIFMYWDKPIDDHTPRASLTYDVFLDGVRNYQAGEFDLINERRLTVTHGNKGTKNFRLLEQVDPSELKFAIQAVDNSFHAGIICVGGLGDIGGGTSAQCPPIVVTEQLSACSQEKVELTSPSHSLWFSFKDGFLGISSAHSFFGDNTEKGDTIFYYNPADEKGCPSLKAWTIKIDNDTSKIELEERYGCEGASIELNVEPGWENVEWSSDNDGNLGSSDSIHLILTEADSITVRTSNAYGCHIVRKTALKISKPVVSVSADHYKIMKGGEVQLQATGAQRYSWAPSVGLSQTDVPDPVAVPTGSIQYVVTGYDSLDCVGHDTVTVTVEMSGFIPNLFSPNDDGQNDELRIYGLSSADGFSFTIYDREGALVYKTSEITEAVQRGWDGTKNGNKQPPGVYFWKVKGEVGPDRLLLNGKDSGSIVLIR